MRQAIISTNDGYFTDGYIRNLGLYELNLLGKNIFALKLNL